MNSVTLASKHNIKFNGPATNFFEGALLGNGGMGVVVTTRPDAICFHLAHNNVWDIRISEKNKDKIGTFQEIFNKIKNIDENLNSLAEDPWYAEYMNITSENYNEKYPRPFPCGTLMLFYDRRRGEVLSHTLDISNGLLTINMLVDNEPYTVKAIVDQSSDCLRIKTYNKGCKKYNIFNRVRIIPEEDNSSQLPKYHILDTSNNSMTFKQILPFQTPEEIIEGQPHIKDKEFYIHAKFSESITNNNRLHSTLNTENDLDISINIIEGLVSEHKFNPSTLISKNFLNLVATNSLHWRDYWEKSSISLCDNFLEEVWYRNLYFMKCCTSSKANCPGLFANWMLNNIGTSWHGDYHFNYNIQQPFWGTFSSNHPENHLPYISLVESLMNLSEKWAKEYYNMDGAFFPHSAYPVEMNIMPYPVPTWGWEVCETPWAVQSLWWHYLYTGDKELLKERLFYPIKSSVTFLVNYITRPDTHGELWYDSKYHIFPTVVPELYELTPGFKMNSDCIIDLTLTKFIFKAFIKACHDLDILSIEYDLITKCEDILNNFPDYEKAESKFGTVFLNVKGENPEVIQNVPISTSPVFPGEDIGIDSDKENYRIAVQTWLNHRNEGGNDLVFYNLQGARLGILDLERFKRQIKYCMLPNGTCGDRVLLSGGRYADTTDFDFMMHMGIWFENFALSGVITECLLHGHTDTIRLFPNWDINNNASFRDLRTAGSFLVSAICSDGEITRVEILSENGGTLKLHNPWGNKAYCNDIELAGTILIVETTPGQKLCFIPS